MRQRPWFHEHWFGPAKRKRLHVAMQAVTASRGAVIEVGCWEGRSTIEIANFFPSHTVIAIDHWRGDETDPGSGVMALAAQRDVYADFIANMQAATAGNYRVARMGWQAFGWSEQAIRFLFIDGEHTYDQVHANIQVALPQLELGGVLAGDDYTIPAVAKAVRAALGEPVHCEGPGAAIWYWVKGAA